MMRGPGGFLSLFLTVGFVVDGQNASFVKVKCNTENVGHHGQQSLVECVLETTSQDVTMIDVVTWKKAGVVLLVFNDGEIKNEPGYTFAEPSWNDNNMNVSLLISRTTVADEGSYTCMVMSDRGSDIGSASLTVTAKYNKPTVAKVNSVDTQTTLSCVADGGYPKGELRWFDEHNVPLLTTPTVEKLLSNGLFQLLSELSLPQMSNSSKYTCTVFDGNGSKEDEATFEIPVVPKPEEWLKNISNERSDTTSKIVTPLVVIGSLIVGLLLVGLLCRKRLRRDHIRMSIHEADAENGDHGDTDENHKDSEVSPSEEGLHFT